jgi:hypothetical protein
VKRRERGALSIFFVNLISYEEENRSRRLSMNIQEPVAERAGGRRSDPFITYAPYVPTDPEYFI